MMGEHPYMPQFVRQHGIDLLVSQTLEKSVLDREPKGLASIRWRFDGDDERDLPFDRDVDSVGNPQLAAQTIDHELNALDEER